MHDARYRMHKKGIRSQKTGEKSHNIEQGTNEHLTLNAQHRTSNKKKGSTSYLLFTTENVVVIRKS